MHHPRLVLAAAASLTALAGSAFAETKSYDVEDFTGVRSFAGVDVEVTVGGDFSVTLDADSDIDRASVEVKNGVLVLGRENRKGLNWSFGRGPQFKYTVSMPSLDEARSSSGSELVISGIDSGEVELESSSGSDLTASGRCGRLRAEASSGSDIRAYGLTCENVRASASSGAQVEVTATQSIRASASSGGDVDVRGNPKERDTSESSGGDVSVSG